MRFFTSALFAGLLLSTITFFPNTAIAQPIATDSFVTPGDFLASQLLSNDPDRAGHRGSGRREMMEYMQSPIA